MSSLFRTGRPFNPIHVVVSVRSRSSKEGGVGPTPLLSGHTPTRVRASVILLPRNTGSVRWARVTRFWREGRTRDPDVVNPSFDTSSETFRVGSWRGRGPGINYRRCFGEFNHKLFMTWGRRDRGFKVCQSPTETRVSRLPLQRYLDTR